MVSPNGILRLLGLISVYVTHSNFTTLQLAIHLLHQCYMFSYAALLLPEMNLAIHALQPFTVSLGVKFEHLMAGAKCSKLIALQSLPLENSWEASPESDVLMNGI